MTIVEKALDDLYPLISPKKLAEYAKLFRRDLIASLSNQRSSLPAILNPVHRMHPEPGFGVAVSIGGTNGYASAFRISKKKEIKFLNRKTFSLPAKTTKEALFQLITKHVLAVTRGRKNAFSIGVGFAYPLKPLLHHGFIDGELLFMSKGRKIEGLLGKCVGREYHRFLKKEFDIDVTVYVANDSICLLLGGNEVEIAGVVGTGLNFAYWEKRLSIAPMRLTQLPRFSQGEVAVNIESKNFDGTEGTKLRSIVDKESDDPGHSLSEKEVSGDKFAQK